MRCNTCCFAVASRVLRGLGGAVMSVQPFAVRRARASEVLYPLHALDNQLADFASVNGVTPSMAWYAYCISEKQAFPELARHRKPVPMQSLTGISGNQIFLYPARDLAVIVSEHNP